MFTALFLCTLFSRENHVMGVTLVPPNPPRKFLREIFQTSDNKIRTTLTIFRIKLYYYCFKWIVPSHKAQQFSNGKMLAVTLDISTGWAWNQKMCLKLQTLLETYDKLVMINPELPWIMLAPRILWDLPKKCLHFLRSLALVNGFKKRLRVMVEQLMMCLPWSLAVTWLSSQCLLASQIQL